MSITNGPNLGLLENANTGEAHDTALRALLRGLDGLVMPNAKGYLINTPPGSPTNGDLYIIGAAPTGAWAGQGGKVARYSTIAVAWEFYTPKNGWMIQANSAREIYRYTASAWEIFYQEGTYAPSTNLNGTPNFSQYKYTRIGNRWDFMILVTGTAMVSTANTTYISLPVTPSVVGAAPTTNTSIAFSTVSLIYTDGKLYLPTISATANIVVSGTIYS